MYLRKWYVYKIWVQMHMLFNLGRSLQIGFHTLFTMSGLSHICIWYQFGTYITTFFQGKWYLYKILVLNCYQMHMCLNLGRSLQIAGLTPLKWVARTFIIFIMWLELSHYAFATNLVHTSLLFLIMQRLNSN